MPILTPFFFKKTAIFIPKILIQNMIDFVEQFRRIRVTGGGGARCSEKNKDMTVGKLSIV